MALIEPHGGTLRVLYLPSEEAAAFKLEAAGYPSWDLSQRQLCDLKLLLNGGFSPLAGFLGEQDYEQVLERMRLRDGTLWPIPVTLDVARKVVDGLRPGQRIGLRDPEGFLIAAMTVESIWEPDRRREAQAVFGTTDEAHPGVDYLLNQTHPVCLGGPLVGIARPVEYDFTQLRDDPQDLRAKFERWGWQRVVAFQTRNPMHRAHKELTQRAAQIAEANLLIHPVVGQTKPGDVDHFARVRCYEQVLKTYPEQTTLLSLLPLAMRMAGPREAVWHAIIRKNFGCTHFIVGRDHAGPGSDRSGKPFYGPYDAQALLQEVQSEIGIQMVPFKEMAYVQDRGQYVPQDEVRPGETLLSLSGTEFRRRLREGIDIPAWFSYPEVVEELRRRYPPKHRQGFTVLFTGLSGAGKSTLANALMIKLLELGGRSVTLLDGDLVRKHLSSELGFSKEHRDLNILRIGFVASEITKAGGVAICAPIAPYATIRRRMREMVEAYGTFIEIYVATPLEVCEQRDTKGLYAKARAGLLSHFTGIDDPYEPPEAPDVVIHTESELPDAAAQRIVLKLEALGLIK
ncbi:MAG TPA: bifunctional sulfate adenylyltransferase/adenylylsulfate kinase [Geminicoccaceae bacterium]|jgi:sulfate adenylyltransferase|nr:bifunctional sulfate adenylyltransferase/adenylylsulfate kinase [Geminicoccaceae bacterium]